MSNRWMLLAVGAVGVLAGITLGNVHPALAQRIDPAFSPGTFQVSAGQNEAWRVNTSTGETYHCLGGTGAPNCRRLVFK